MAEFSLQQRLLHGESLPNGWRVTKFGSATRIANGQVSPIKTPYDEYSHIGPENIESHTGRIGRLKTSKELGLISGKYLFDEKAIVYAKIRPNLNKVCVPGFTGVCSADAYPIWIANGKVDRDFLAHFMRSELFLRQSIAASMRTGMPKINRPDLQGLKLVLPPLSEQKKIAVILNDYSRGEELTRKLMHAKQRFKRALMQQLFAGNCVLPGIQYDWRDCRLGDLFRSRRERGRDGLPLMSVTMDSGLVERASLDRKTDSELTAEEHLFICKGDIAYNMMRMWQGACGLAHHDGIVSPAYVVVVPTDDIDPLFASYWFKSARMLYLLWAYSYGLTGDRLRLYFKDFTMIPVVVPSRKAQEFIAQLLKTCDDEIALLQRQLEAFKTQRKGLMQKLLTGQIRIPADTSTSVEVY